MFAALCMLLLAGPQQVFPQSSVYQVDDQTIYDLATDVVPGGRTGAVRADLSLQSNRVHPVTGHYLPPLLSACWKITASNGVDVHTVPACSHAWHGWRLPRDPLQLLAFNEFTGAATVRIVIPVGHQGALEYPLLPDGPSALHLRIGWADTIIATDSQEPTGYDWTSEVAVSAAVPDVWLWLTEAEAQHDSPAQVVLRCRLPSAADRTFDVLPNDTSLLEQSSYSVTLPAGESLAVFEVHTANSALGTLRLYAYEDGAQVGISNSASVTVGGNSQGMPGGGQQVPDVEQNNYKDCDPGSGVVGGGSQRSVCGPCVRGGGHSPNCPGVAVFVSGGSCFTHPFMTCTITKNVTYTGDGYTFSHFETRECGSFGSSLWGFVSGQGKLYEICCYYDNTGQQGTGTGNQCSGQ